MTKDKNANLFIQNDDLTVADPEGVHGIRLKRGSLESPLRQNHFTFLATFQKNQEKTLINNNQVKLSNGTPFKNLNPLYISSNPGSVPV